MNYRIRILFTLLGGGLLAVAAGAAEIDPTWESLRENYEVPQWVVDGKLGIWMHWGISSTVDGNRSNVGSRYGRNMYGGGKKIAKTLCEWHTKRYGPLETGARSLTEPLHPYSNKWFKKTF